MRIAAWVVLATACGATTTTAPPEPLSNRAAGPVAPTTAAASTLGRQCPKLKVVVRDARTHEAIAGAVAVIITSVVAEETETAVSDEQGRVTFGKHAVGTKVAAYYSEAYVEAPWPLDTCAELVLQLDLNGKP